MDKTRWNEIQAVVLFAIAILIFISLVTFDFSDMALFTSRPNYSVRNFAGLFGVYLGFGLFFVMGLSAYVIPLLVLTWAIARFYGITPQKIYFKLFGTFFLILASSAIFSIVASGDNSFRFRLGGAVGLVFSDFLIKYLGKAGALVVIAVLFLLSILLATEFLLLPFLSTLFSKSKGLLGGLFGRLTGEKEGPKIILNVSRKPTPAERGADIIRQAKEAISGRKQEPPPRKSEEAKPSAAQARPAPEKEDAAKKVATPVPASASAAGAAAQDIPKVDAVKAAAYRLPSMNLLASPPPLESRKIKENFDANARILEETLRDFEIEAKVVTVNRGPVITRYELEPAPGVKIQKVTALSDNIALTMKAQSVRIVAPIPGKGTIGVEVPNATSALVYLKEVIDSREYKESRSKLKLALGKDIAGTPVIADLASMPHLLIAGATGSGKTVCINSVITNLLLSYTPEELKFIMIDPKRVELAAFNNLPHLLTPVVTDAKRVGAVLDWIVSKMESRYELFAQAGVRNIDAYNERIGKDITEKLPYIIIVIDELADLMMVAQADVEGAITRLAQLSRAVGIHIILATQRPSVDVITGVIKANFPARISFKVASKVDSRTVLDINGADKLLGRGDMLFIEPGASRPIRAQCSLIADREIEAITDFIKSQRQPQYVEEISDDQKRQSFKKFDKDEVYDEAVRLVLETRQASVSILQRRLGLGYTRAARLIDMMEDEGIVGPYQGSKPRDILVSTEEYQAKNGS
ncbi:MAG: DNA translocase FtsK [Candidatus Omnitrophica bacterium]|nr:DNA translocase FtsK [Candidatus Omnitrophota bacterium]